MKTLLFATCLLLVISLSTGTAMAQCSASYPVSFPNADGSFSCVGDGHYGDGGFGQTSNGVCVDGAGSACGQCYDNGTQLSPYGLCLIPPCTGWVASDWNYDFGELLQIGYSEYSAYMVLKQLFGCDPYDWSKKMKAPVLPWKIKAPELIEAYRMPFKREDA